MITFIAHMIVRPINVPAYEALITDVRDQTLAQEPGVAWYSFARSEEVADGYVVVEVYRNAAAHAAHLAKSYVIASIPKSRALIEGGFDIRQYTSPRVDPAQRLAES